MPKQGSYRGAWSAKYNNPNQWIQVGKRDMFVIISSIFVVLDEVR